MKGGFRSWLDRFECLEGNEATARELRAMLPGMLVEQVAAVFLELVNVFVSGFFSTAAMAGVGQINTVNSVLMNLFQAFAIGGTAIVSQHAGAARRGEAARNAFSALTLGLTVSVVITALIFALRGEFVMLLFGDAEAEVIASSNVYFGFTALAPPLWFIYFQCCGFMRAAGDTKRPMYVSIVLNVSSLALNLALTFALDMGVTGTALSYLLSLAIAAALSLAMVLRRGFELRPKRCGAGELAANIRAITAISVPSSAENLMFNGSRIVLQSFLAGMGAAMISGNSVFNSVNGIFNVPVMALYYLTIPIVGRCAGEGDLRARLTRAEVHGAQEPGVERAGRALPSAARHTVLADILARLGGRSRRGWYARSLLALCAHAGRQLHTAKRLQGGRRREVCHGRLVLHGLDSPRARHLDTRSQARMGRLRNRAHPGR